eukprot:Hpha_TRINITY_DN13558_c0_g1::TRINITY_DN13558_c0_g1_i1::g.111473::m.111473
MPSRTAEAEGALFRPGIVASGFPPSLTQDGMMQLLSGSNSGLLLQLSLSSKRSPAGVWTPEAFAWFKNPEAATEAAARVRGSYPSAVVKVHPALRWWPEERRRQPAPGSVPIYPDGPVAADLAPAKHAAKQTAPVAWVQEPMPARLRAHPVTPPSPSSPLGAEGPQMAVPVASVVVPQMATAVPVQPYNPSLGQGAHPSWPPMVQATAAVVASAAPVATPAMQIQGSAAFAAPMQGHPQPHPQAQVVLPQQLQPQFMYAPTVLMAPQQLPAWSAQQPTVVNVAITR